MRKRRTAIAVISAAMFSTAAVGSDVITSRQSDMKAMAAAAKTLNDYFTGKRIYDLPKFKAEADIIRHNAGRIHINFASVVGAPDSQASPFIKVDHAKFDGLARQLERYAAQVSSAASDGRTLPDRMRMKTAEIVEGGPFAKKKALPPDVSSYTSEHAFHMMLQTCSSCHAAFRLQQP